MEINQGIAGGESHGNGKAKTESTDPIAKKMEDYQKYIEELYRRYPHTYISLHSFIKRGNCKCQTRCSCIQLGNLCDCTEPDCKCGTKAGPECESHPIKHTVCVYEIHPSETHWERFLVREEYNAGHEYDIGPEKGLQSLQARLSEIALETINRPNGEDDDSNENSRDEDDPSKPFHLITVDHLSATVVKLLGGIYDVSADFFNCHLPGTEAILGKLVSRLPSVVQIDFDEIYEGEKMFSEIWNGRNIKDGHLFIHRAMESNFMFQDVGWDYFPVQQQDWEKSIENLPLSSGFEVKSRYKGNKAKSGPEEWNLKNIFQFNLTHRISVYSKPPGQPKTAIILFYPSLPICGTPEHYPSREGHKFPPTSDCKNIYFRGTPDRVPKMSAITYPSAEEDGKASQMPSQTVPYSPYNTSGKEGLRPGEKLDYASAFDREFRMHLEWHWKRANPERSKGDAQPPYIPVPPKLVHLFGIPLFKLMAANWARLIVRRSFDLDLLEWRPSDRLHSDTVQEIKSRRVAILRHQKDINASVEVLRGLAQEESDRSCRSKANVEPITMDPAVATLVSMPESNLELVKGRRDGLMSEMDGNTWQGTLSDFLELKTFMDSLEKRADKIEQGMTGLISVNMQTAGNQLGYIAGVFSVVLLPFTIVGTLYTAGISGRRGPHKKWMGLTGFWGVYGLTLLAAFVLIFFTIWVTEEKRTTRIHKFKTHVYDLLYMWWVSMKREWRKFRKARLERKHRRKQVDKLP